MHWCVKSVAHCNLSLYLCWVFHLAAVPACSWLLQDLLVRPHSSTLHQLKQEGRTMSSCHVHLQAHLGQQGWAWDDGEEAPGAVVHCVKCGCSMQNIGMKRTNA